MNPFLAHSGTGQTKHLQVQIFSINGNIKAFGSFSVANLGSLGVNGNVTGSTCVVSSMSRPGSPAPPPRSTTGGKERQEERAAGVDDEQEEEESDLDLGELELAMECGADGDSRTGTAGRRRGLSAARPTATANFKKMSY